MSAKAERVAEANKAIAVIAKHGRRFFYSQKFDRTGHFSLGGSGHIYFTDDYTGKRIYVAYRYRWSGWSHGGTLRDLVRALADYIRTGTPISIDWIGPERFDQSNIWGYDEEAMKATRAEILLTNAVRPHQEATNG